MENVNNTNIDQNEEGVITDLRSIAFRGEYPPGCYIRRNGKSI